VFAGAPLAFSYLIRKYFLTAIIFIQSHPIEFECAVGVNAHGTDWTKLMKSLESHGEKNGIAGDYKAYDTTCSSTIMSAAYRLIMQIIEAANDVNKSFSEDDLIIMRGLITDLCQPVYEHDGNLLSVVGSNPSGHNLTVVINNLCNSLYMRYSYYGLSRKTVEPLVPFNEVVDLLCYGDDNKMGVCDSIPWFNHTSISSYLATIGVVYTMADKSSVSIPYIPLHSATFLKRGAVWDTEFEQYLAPIELDSIFKSLHCRRKCSDLPTREHSAAQIQNACTEFFYHGEEVYNFRVSQLDQIVVEHELEHFVPKLPTYSEQRKLYRMKYL
jgi:hypothetical protein